MNILTAEGIQIPITASSHFNSSEFSRASVYEDTYYLALLAVCAVKDYLSYVGISTDVNYSECWTTKLKAYEIADLFLPEIGTIECRPFLADSDSFYTVPGTELGRICFVAVKLDDDLREASILGFYPIVDKDNVPETINISELRPIDDFIDFLYLIKAFRAALCDDVIAEICNADFDNLVVYLEYLFAKNVSSNECLEAIVKLVCSEQNAKQLVEEYYDILDIDLDNITDQFALEALHQIIQNVIKIARVIWIEHTQKDIIEEYTQLYNTQVSISINKNLQSVYTKLSDIFNQSREQVLDTIDYAFQLADNFMGGKIDLTPQLAFRSPDTLLTINPTHGIDAISRSDSDFIDNDNTPNESRWKMGKIYSETLECKSAIFDLAPLPVNIIMCPIDREDEQVTIFLTISLLSGSVLPNSPIIHILDSKNETFTVLENWDDKLFLNYIFTVNEHERFGFRVIYQLQQIELFFEV